MGKEGTERKFLVREFDENRDNKVVGKLERNPEIENLGNKKRVSIFTNMIMGDPLSRIRFYPLHVMLVAELLENGELVGVVRGCIKSVGTKSGSTLKIGSILGLRVSSDYRRKGVGSKLINSIEEWMVRNGAEYTQLATEKKNDASKKLFTIKCNYFNLSSLIIFVHPTSSFPPKNTSMRFIRHIKIDKLSTDQAISLYGRSLKAKDLFPTDMDAILKEKLSLGTWVCYYKDEANNWFNIEAPTSNWVIFSLWNNACEYEANNSNNYELQIRKPHHNHNHHHHHHHPLGFLHTTLNHARDKIFPCLRMLVSGSSMSRPFGFLFMYGIHGEGDNLGELMESIWRFTSRLGENMKGCKVIISELGLGDPLVSLVPKNASMSFIEDLWYIKRLSSHTYQKDELLMKGDLGNVFVDPRDF